MANSGVVAASDVADGSPNLSPEAVSWSLLVGRMPRLPSPGPPRLGGGDASRPRDRSKTPRMGAERWSIHPLYVSGVRPAPKGRGSHSHPKGGIIPYARFLISWRSRGGSGDSRGRASGDRGTGAAVAAPAGQPEMESVGATE